MTNSLFKEAESNRDKSIPLNMSQPILIAEHSERPDGKSLGFAPHGAGRNMSRTQHIKRLSAEFGEERLSAKSIRSIVGRETAGLDVHFYSGLPDVSELPSAYKDAEQVAAQIKKNMSWLQSLIAFCQ